MTNETTDMEIETASVTKLVYSVSEVAELLGISRGSAYTYVRNGTIRSVTIGKRIVVPKQSIDELLTIETKAS